MKDFKDTEGKGTENMGNLWAPSLCRRENWGFWKLEKNEKTKLVLLETVMENFSKVPEQGSERLFQKRASNGKW